MEAGVGWGTASAIKYTTVLKQKYQGGTVELIHIEGLFLFREYLLSV